MSASPGWRLAQGPLLASGVHRELDSSGVFVLCFLRAADWRCIHTALVGRVSVWRGERWGSHCRLLLHGMSQGTCWNRTLQGTRNAGACAAPAPKAQGNTSPYKGERRQAVERLHQAKVSATEPRVTDEERARIYWENCPIKNTLEDPVYCLIPFKYSTVTNTPYSYKLKKEVRQFSHTLSSPQTQQTCGTLSRQRGSDSLGGSSWEMLGHLHHG